MARVKDEKYDCLLDDFKKALERDIHVSLASFCRSIGQDVVQMQHWLNHHGYRVSAIRNEILLKQKKISKIPEVPPGVVHMNLWGKFKEHVENGNNISLRSFCILNDVEYRPMEKWVARNNLSVTDLKIRAGIKTLPQDVSSETPFTPEAVKRLSKALKTYKVALCSNPNFSLSAHCSNEHVDYYLMQKWLQHVGLTVRQLKQSALLEEKVSRKRKPVFVQFRPNGGSNSDKLTGVKIQLADGSNILVEECTVISLCAFINKYDSDQRRKDRNDV